MSFWNTSRLLVLPAAAVLALPACAQNISSGALTGTVLAPDGVPVAHADLSLVLPDATTRHIATGPDGSFLVRDLPSGTYNVSAQAEGFAALAPVQASVAVGRTTRLDLRLHLATEQQSVSVTAQPVTLDTAQTSSVVNIDRDRVEEAPIPSRNYLSFVLLSPQVAAANPALTPQGVPQTTGSFSFGGLRPGSNAIYLDEVNDNDEYTGSSRTQLSPEAISDFQIVNHSFAAESGGGAGGSIDVQSRVGVNAFHGDAFTFTQNSALNATQPLVAYPTRPDEKRERFGVALGGPIRRDRTFFYIAGEQEIAHGQDASDLKPATRAAIQTALSGYAPYAGFQLANGLFPTADQETELSARVDHKLTNAHSLMLRYAFTNSRNVNDAFSNDEITDSSARGSAFIADNSLNGTMTSTAGSSLLNKLSFEVAQRRALDRTGQQTVPGILLPGAALFGTPYSGNDRRFETHVEVSDAISLQRKAHLWQAGVRADHVALRTRVPDASQGFFVFSDLAALQAGNPDFFAKNFGQFNTNLAELRFAAYAQDHWTATHSLTLDYGLRYEFNNLPSSLPEHRVNFSPRVGAAWTPYTSLVVRAGFGLFYDRFQLATVNRLLELDGAHAQTQIVEDSTAATLFKSGQVPSSPIAGVAPSIWRSASMLNNPYSEVASLGAEQSLPWQTTLKGEYQYVHGIHLGRTSNVNLTPPVQLTSSNAASLGVSNPTPQQLGSLVFSPTRVNPSYDAINQFSTTAGSTYHAATVTVNRQFQDDLQILAGYTYSKTIDDASYDFEQPQNPFLPGAERALSLADSRHRFTLSGLWLLGPDLGDPADAAKNANPGPLMKVLYGFEFAPIVSLYSGFRANPTTGLDSNREHIFPFAARPQGFARNSLHTPANVNVDLRVLRMVPVRGGHLDIVAESFNILNHRNVTLLNTDFGSGAQPSAAFGHPIATSTARRIQFSLDYEF